ncbi:MAG: BolA/IbaG family iron-sulfur metabolism protein [Chromatiaceae bacterium]|nr:BolA/IbaG family iron-sulfur metabolism protein [Gammaproteobacteria bacterium]MCP5306956.1 BolA/IbaG family iron-sulfur metabolism protein [Chromatiaceae bacterium]
MRIQQQIEHKLRERFAPLHLEVANESHMHNVPEGSESHFRVVLVSDQFADKSLIQRHRAVNQALSAELQGSVHALALHTMTPEEWFEKGGAAPESPPCLGGGKA